MIVAPVKIMHQVSTVLSTLLFTIPNASEFMIAQVSILCSRGSSLADCAEEPA